MTDHKKSKDKTTTKRKPNPEGVKALAEIQKFAKEIRAKNPDKKWSDCIKEASAKYRENKKK